MHTRKRTGAKRSAMRLVIDDDDDEVENTGTGGQDEGTDSPLHDEIIQDKKVTVDEDITKLETPTFTTIDRGPPEPMHQNKKLRWDHKVNLIGEKVVNPRIHCCEKCSLPILIYGRMIPCKHVFCYDCARKTDKVCPRCSEKVTRVEQSALGTVFMCTFGATRHGTAGCRRTYLSQRDLQAHINHRHMRPAAIPSTATTVAATHTAAPAALNTTVPPASVPTNPAHPPPHPRDPRHVGHVGLEGSSHTPPTPHPQAAHSLPPATHIHPHVQQEFREAPDTSRPPPGIPPVSVSLGSTAPPSRYSHPATTAAYLHNSYPSPIPVVSTRSNLITVPIQDDNAAPSNQHVHVQAHQPPPQYPTPSPVGPPHQPPPMQPQHPTGPNPYPPVPHHYQHPPPNAPQPAYSQAPPPAYGSPPVNTQSFGQTHPPHVPPPPVHNAAPPVYSAPAPPMHHPPPTTYSSPNTLPPPPQRFPPSSPYDESTYSQPWGTGSVPPAPSHGPLPPRPLSNPPGTAMGMPQPCAPTEQSYRPPYYQ